MSLKCSLYQISKLFVKNSRSSFGLHGAKFGNICKSKNSDTSSGEYWKHKYDLALQEAVNKQIQAEQQAAQDYLSMAVYFLHPKISRPGHGGFFMLMFEEEIGHMQDFIQYQLLRGGDVTVSSLIAPKLQHDLSPLKAFTTALEMEKAVTVMIENLVKTAETSKDFQAADYFTSVFLAEQMKSVNEMAHHISKLTKLTDEHAIYHYDLRLLQSHPYVRKKQQS